MVDVIVHPDIWTKLTALGTVGAVAAAVLLAVGSGLAARRSRNLQDDHEARAEARKVVVIPTADYNVDLGAVRATVDHIDMVNAGSEPILEARLIYGDSDPGSPSMDHFVWMHGNGRGTSYSPLILPGERFQFSGDWQAQVSVPRGAGPSEADRGGFYGVVAWSDARNRHWMRRGRDQPIELRKPAVYGHDPVPVHRPDNKTRTVSNTRDRWAQDRAALDAAKRQ